MLEGENRVGAECGLGATDEVYVEGFDVVAIERTYDAYDHHPPVSALGNCGRR